MEENTSVDSTYQTPAPAAPATAQTAAPSTPAPSEKMVTMSQGEIDRIVKTAKVSAAERERGRMIAENNTQQSPAQQHPAAGMTAEQVRQLVAQETEAKLSEMRQKATEEANFEQGKKVVGEFFSKLQAAKDEYPDIDEVVGNIPLAQFPHVVGLAHESDLTADIIHDLGKNPAKLAMIENVASKGIVLGRIEMNKLIESIRLNKQAKNVKTARAPLSQIQPSPTGLDNGSYTLKDMKKNPKYRG